LFQPFERRGCVITCSSIHSRVIPLEELREGSKKCSLSAYHTNLQGERKIE